MPAFMRGNPTTRAAWELEPYFDIVEHAVRSRRDVTRGAPRTDSAMHLSPRKKRRTSGEIIPTVFLSAWEVHNTQQRIGDSYRFDGFLVFIPDELRQVEIQNKKSGVTDEQTLLTLVLADYTGPFDM